MCVCVWVRDLSHKLRLLPLSHGDVQAAHAVEELVDAQVLPHSSLLEELRPAGTGSGSGGDQEQGPTKTTRTVK